MTCHQNACGTEQKACSVKVYLANLAVWNAKLHNLHWNVTGSAFVQVHEYTESLYDSVFEQYDEVAEAIKMRGGFPPVRLADFIEMATIEELDSRDYTVAEVLDIVQKDMMAMKDLATEIRNGADERGDFLMVAQFEGYIAAFQKSLWFMRAMTK